MNFSGGVRTGNKKKKKKPALHFLIQVQYILYLHKMGAGGAFQKHSAALRGDENI